MCVFSSSSGLIWKTFSYLSIFDQVIQNVLVTAKEKFTTSGRGVRGVKTRPATASLDGIFRTSSNLITLLKDIYD